MDVLRFDSKEEALSGAVSKLNSILESKADILLMLSGGYSLNMLPLVETKLMGSNVTVTVLDERYSWDEDVNNFAQIAASDMFKAAVNNGASFIDTRLKDDDNLHEHASRFASGLSAWRVSHPDGIIVGTVGIGDDGHVAGIMPYPDDPDIFTRLFDGGRLVIGYDAGDKNPYPLRVTPTMTFLRDLDHSISLVTGEDKKESFDRVLAKDGHIWETPARILHEMTRSEIFTDIR